MLVSVNGKLDNLESSKKRLHEGSVTLGWPAEGCLKLVHTGRSIPPLAAPSLLQGVQAQAQEHACIYFSLLLAIDVMRQAI